MLLAPAPLRSQGGRYPPFSGSGEGGRFIRGDSDQNGVIEITDPIFTLGYLFTGGKAPYCLDALDSDDDGKLILADAIAVLESLFNGSNVIPQPFPEAGADPTPDDLDCDNGMLAFIRREVFSKSCATASCHSLAVAGGGLILEGLNAYGQVFDVAPQDEAAGAAGLKRVAPGRPEQSFLFRKITGAPSPGEDPHGGAQLGAPEIKLIRDWIEHGAVPSSPADIRLLPPEKGEQIVIAPFPVGDSQEVQRNYYFKLKTETDIWVDRLEFLCPPGNDHVNLFSGPARGFEDGYFEDKFRIVSFADWTFRASSQAGRLDWKLPPGAALKLKAREQLLIQVHFVNITGGDVSPIGGGAVINLHAVDPGPEVSLLGSLFIQDRSIVIRPKETVSFDYGVTLDRFDYEVPVKVAALEGHFHWRGKTFEVRLWDGLNRNFDGSPAPGEFDRMGSGSTIYLSNDWSEPPFNTFDDGPEIPPGWGFVYRTTYTNDTFEKFCFGPHAETKEHSNVFFYFYPGPGDAGFFWFPPECLGQGCTVPCF